MFPPDPYGQFDEQPLPDATEQPDTQPTAVPRNPTQSHPYHEPRAGGAPLPLPYDDYDPTYQDTPPHQPPVYQEQQPSTYPGAEPNSRGLRRIFRARQPRASGGQVYAPAPHYQAPIVYQPQPPPQQQIIYVRERRPSFFSISCSILAILLLMACGLTGIAVYRGVIYALQTAPANIIMTGFCTYESNQLYGQAFNLLSSDLQQRFQGGESTFQSDNVGFNQTDGFITSCGQTSNSSDAVNGDSVRIEVTVTRRGGSSVNGYFDVQKQGNAWYITHIDSQLNLV
jgi:hypothetical protein